MSEEQARGGRPRGQASGQSSGAHQPALDAAAVPEQPAKPAPKTGSGADLAREALRAAQKQAREQGLGVHAHGPGRRGGRRGARGEGREPLAFGAAIHRLMSDRGWETRAAVGGVMNRWPQIVGEDVARNSEPLHYDEDERVLRVRCQSNSWATELRLLAPQLVARLNEALGHDTVRLLRIEGPSSPSRRYGPLRAPGSRGDRDTWG
ncbi:Predicted nucleic acid-binding protein, contains Zn-ribbon domain (includes truncated derivatives) [Streptomyces sp. LcepLS]|uniref:DUF721 domain-containing protein n=1 Tax=Streptomyces sp. LcepLS TaxID=1839764 RepID=UPI00081E3DAA|nr:DciA family protein [Streptomyces sp. SID4945]SCF45058.1 Predicted nucleic acid-binding protein, contains Zn-ribbon domain (includes truncated derivatives) [Streptomyces sp. LcepLS]